MKRFVLFVGVLAVLGGGGYLLYHWLYGEREEALWTLIPPDAIAVYETRNLQDTWESLQGHPFLSLGKAWYAYGPRHTAVLDSLLAQGDFFSRFITDLSFALSLHRTGKDSFDLLYYSHLPLQAQQTLLATWLAQLQKSPFMQNTRKYRDYTITEISLEGSMTPLSYITHKDYFIASLTPLLVEDVIRRLDDKKKIHFDIHRQDLRPQIPWEQHNGILHMDAKRLTKFLEVFTGDIPAIPQAWPMGLAQLTVHVLRGSLLMDGAVGALDSTHQSPSGFIERTAQALPYAQFVPNRTRVLFAYSFEDAKAWNNRMLAWWRKQQADVVERRIQLFARHQIDIDALFAHIRRGAGVSTLSEAPGRDTAPDTSQEKLFFLHTKDMANLQALLNTWSTQLNRPTRAALAPYRDYTFRYLPLQDLPYLLFGAPFAGFSELFYIPLDNFLVASSSLSTLKDLIDSIEREDVWGKTPAINDFLKNTSSQAHLALYVNTSPYTQEWSQTFKKPWDAFFARHAWEEPRLLALQMEAHERTWHLHALWEPPSIPDAPVPPRRQLARAPAAAAASTQAASAEAAYTLKHSLSLAYPLLTKPYAIYHPLLRKYHVFLQDTAYQLYMLSENERIAWFLPLGERLQSPVYGIDYYNNGRMQYLFLTTGKLHILDRTGAYVKGFPRALPTQDALTFLSLVDYNQNKNYRFFVSDAKGRLFITDKQGKPLEGWAPKALPYPLVSPPLHVRTGGPQPKDCMITLQTDGTLQLFRRNGNTYPGFPVKLPPLVSAAPVFNLGTSLAASTLSVLTQEGEWIAVSFEGQIKRRQQIAQAAEAARFRLIHETTGDRVLFVRHTPQTLSLYDGAGVLLFEKAQRLTAAFTGQYYDFGAGQAMVILNDPQAEKTYFYDLAGDAHLPSPIQTKFGVGMLYSSGQNTYQIFRAHRNNYAVLEHTP